MYAVVLLETRVRIISQVDIRLLSFPMPIPKTPPFAIVVYQYLTLVFCFGGSSTLFLIKTTIYGYARFLTDTVSLLTMGVITPPPPAIIVMGGM